MRGGHCSSSHAPTASQRGSWRSSSFPWRLGLDELQRPGRTPPSLSFARPSDQGEPPVPCRRPSMNGPAVGREEASPAAPMAAAAVLAGAQSRHAIFHEELVRRAYYTADEAHRGHSSQPATTSSGLL
ncbi:hypothetical protein ZWY2020_041075 [Hordeum vulgare]|nr:hypothetical protein ZWY2020_041075 [Hordeum vulgare]